MLKLDDVISVLAQKKLDKGVLIEVQKELQEIEEENKAARENNVPKAKNQYVIVSNGQVGWVLQIPENEDAGQVLSKLKLAAAATVANMKRKRRDIRTIEEAMRYAKPAFLKEHRLKVKTKEPVRILAPNDQDLNKIV